MMAHSNSLSLALTDWETHHAPTQLIWETVLHSRGYSRVLDVEQRHRVVRSLPLNVDSEGSIWITENGTWIGILTSEAAQSGQGPAIFARFPKKKERPENWSLQGRGWRGFEKVLASLERFKPTPDQGAAGTVAKPRGRVIPKDSREILY